MITEWTRDEFLAYILLYAAQSNFIEAEAEESFILSKVDEKTYNTIHTEIVHDSGNDSVKKIESYLKCNDLSTEEKTQILRDLKKVFFADGSVDKYEKSVFSVLKNLLE